MKKGTLIVTALIWLCLGIFATAVNSIGGEAGGSHGTEQVEETQQ